MGYLLEHCRLQLLTADLFKSCKPLDCGNADLNDFFENEALDYARELLGKTYVFTTDESPCQMVCAFTISNDSIKVNEMLGSRKKKVIKDVPREKHIRSYPAVLIGRLGVAEDFKKRGIGKELMDFIKSWFVDEQKNRMSLHRCRCL